MSNVDCPREKSRILFFRGRNDLHKYLTKASDATFTSMVQNLESALQVGEIGSKKSSLYFYLGLAYKLHYDSSAYKSIEDLNQSEIYCQKALRSAVQEVDLSNMKYMMAIIGEICAIKDDCQQKFNEVGDAIAILNDSSKVIMNKAKSLLIDFEKKLLATKKDAEIKRNWIISVGVVAFIILASIFLTVWLLQKIRIRSLRKEIEAKDAAARAQINPHFISNALFAIDSLLDSGKIRKASRYLVQFDRLYRTVLNSSRKAEISLSDEIQFLKNYLSLEQLRFEDRMTFELRTEQLGNEEGTLIPPMILQPILENAFKHGIQNLPADVKGHIEVKFIRANDQTIRVSVIDDGVGRKKASELRAKSVHKPHGEGQKIIEERIAGFQQKGYMAKLKYH